MKAIAFLLFLFASGVHCAYAEQWFPQPPFTPAVSSVRWQPVWNSEATIWNSPTWDAEDSLPWLTSYFELLPAVTDRGVRLELLQLHYRVHPYNRALSDYFNLKRTDRRFGIWEA